MGFFSNNEPFRPIINDKELACMFCGDHYFRSRQIKLNSTGMELLDLAWANKESTGLICEACGFVHEFVDTEIFMVDE